MIGKVEWRCASKDSGEQCVITSPGISLMQWLPADSFVSPQNVMSYPLTGKCSSSIVHT